MMFNNAQNLDVSNTCQIGRYDTKNCSDKARKRWLLLAQTLLKDKENVCSSKITESQVSVRRFQDFGLFSVLPSRSPFGNAHTGLSRVQNSNLTSWYEYATQINEKIFTINIRHIVKLLTPTDLMGFNNTGNVCVWPSEEVLAYYCLSNREIFHRKSILELGGGMTCLAGIMLAKFANPEKVLLTDGNSESVGNVQAIIDANELPESLVKASVLKWNCDMESFSGGFDVVLAADCLFFEETRNDLVMTIWNSLKCNSFALITAPARGETHSKFLRAAQKVGFITKLYNQNYDNSIYSRHMQLKSTNPVYEEDIHYPLLISLYKPPIAES